MIDCSVEPQLARTGDGRFAERLLTVDGRSLSVGGWARELGIPDDLIRKRLHRGWSDARALEPPRGGGPKREEVHAARKNVCSSHLVFRGRRLPISRWAKIVGVDIETIRRRILGGMTTEQALSA